MKRILFYFFAFSTLIAVAQNKSTVETRALTSNFNKAKSVSNMSQRLLERLPVEYYGDVACIGVLAKVNNLFDAKQLENSGIKVTSRVGNIVSMRVAIEKLALLEGVAGIEVYSVAHRVAPKMDRARIDTRADSVQAGLGVPMPFDGSGVLIGITDWGFDYTHPNINSRNNPRILRAWDHFRLAGPAPEGFDYGTEIIGYDSLKAMGGDTSGLYGYGTHGTHVAGICGGRGTGGNAIGQAPGANFIFGSWYLNEAAWLDQVAWMTSVAKNEGKRLVINGSWGMYTFSTLDGTSLLSQALNSYADSGIVFVTSAGNNGDANFHLHHTFDGSDTLKSIASWLGSGVGEALIYWGVPTGQFKVGFALVKNDNLNARYYSPMYSTSDDIDYLESSLVVGTDTIHYDVMTESSNPLDGRPHALLNVDKNNGYKLMMLCTAEEAGTEVHVWNVGNVANHAGNTGCDFSNYGVFGCQNGDREYGLSEPGCAEKTLTVAAHSSDYYVHDTDYVVGGLAYFSSNGPTLDGRGKPDVSAPGYNVISSISSWTDNIDSYNAVYTTVSSGRSYRWARMSGTSMSSPQVTGVVALMLQANPYITSEQVRDIIRQTARNDNMTGPLHAHDSISLSWGWGKVDALRAVNAAYDLLSVEEAIANQPELVVFPNPASNHVTVLTGSDRKATVELYSINGQIAGRLNAYQGTATINLGGLAKGVYILKVTDEIGTRTAKVVVGD